MIVEELLLKAIDRQNLSLSEYVFLYKNTSVNNYILNIAFDKATLYDFPLIEESILQFIDNVNLSL